MWGSLLPFFHNSLCTAGSGACLLLPADASQWLQQPRRGTRLWPQPLLASWPESGGPLAYLPTPAAPRPPCAEMNDGSKVCRFLQIWLMPDARGHTPQYGSEK